mmetsp:Transcript_22821/g.22041  ORF Transcript_22821/g.22041 Transcript_22821/m.22041 type:complete len:297 (+) Transcript_22821:62-952(+)|eukprot:CAMPEP_0119051576 /NCGR_PEP_ID=MMETSP1177-20130426/73145_1 /TAXON_ID=2985 /ORGANISM="Ochromonas sp, Strain CCMP1899" /LENGTH=296 /DNA_ID=CAMNT_0007030827 /DNA_START=31 /DNA_END=921 /DNA_ORIENTATION=-
MSNFIACGLLLILTAEICQGFISPATSFRLRTIASSVSELSELSLTPQLEKYVTGFKNVVDDKIRYQQLFFLATKCQPMDNSFKIEENKVPGCLSTVHIHATRDDDKIFYLGDADAQMTKGLVAMLVNGLSGHTYEEILAVQPEFIKYAGIGSTLTPGRNNGFLNMMKVMKDKARVLHEEQAISSGVVEAVVPVKVEDGEIGGPIYKSVKMKLGMLKPEELVVEDESHKHSGHAGMAGSDSIESHFNVRIIASCFEGLSLVQRHKMVYTLLGSEMNNGIHALSIYAKTPDEESMKK